MINMKRGQISIFFIVGLLLVAVVGGLLLISGRLPNQNLEQARVEDVEVSLQDCVQDSLKKLNSVDGILVENEQQAETNVRNYVKDYITDICQNEIDERYGNVEKPNDFSIEVDLKKYQGIGTIGQYEIVNARVSYDATVVVNGNRLVIKPIYVEYDFSEL